MLDAGSDANSEMDEDVHASLICPSALSCFLSSLPCACPLWLCSCTIIDQNTQAAVMLFGEYHGSITKPGIQFMNPCGTQLIKISTQRQTHDLQNMKVTDSKGSPILVSGNVVYRLFSAKKAAVDTLDTDTYITQQAAMVLRKVCSRYPYESATGGSLRSAGGDHSVSADLKKSLQEVVHDAGVEVLRFELTDLAYAPEIAAAMLQKQQAEAMIEARQLVVQSAVEIASGAIKRMKEMGHGITPAGEERIIGNLLTVICSDKGSQVTVPC